MKPILTAAIVLGTLFAIARQVPQTGHGNAAVERWRLDQATVYAGLERRVRSGEIKSGDDVIAYFKNARTKVEPNAAGPLGPELGELVHSKTFDKERIANAAARMKAEFQ